MKNLQNLKTTESLQKNRLVNYFLLDFKFKVFPEKRVNKSYIYLLTLFFCGFILSVQTMSAQIIDVRFGLLTEGIDGEAFREGINSVKPYEKVTFQMLNTEPTLVLCKVSRASNSMELRFKNLELTSSDVEITIQSNTGDRLSFTVDDYDIGDDVFIVPLKKNQLKNATSIVVSTIYIDVFKNPQKISLEQNQIEITKL